jgi:plasmid stabilization system protein ParE
LEPYILSTEAQLDLEEIFDYSAQEFNLEQAIK